MRATPALLLTCMALAGCTALLDIHQPSTSDQPDSALRQEAELLLDQPRIDPLTRFLSRHAGLHAEHPDYRRVARERDSRCRAIGTRYSRRTPSAEQLHTLRSGYQYSCPEQVAAFARRVPDAPAGPAADIEHSPAPAPAPQSNDCYLLFTIRNQQQALPACQAAAEAGDARAQHHLASLLRSNRALTDALHWAGQSAAGGYPAGQLLLAELYQRGHGAPGDADRALALIETAAERGLAAAQYHAGMAWLNGLGTEPDRHRALHWLERAALQDDVAAQLQLAELYFSSPTPEQALARQWLNRAATLGSASAQYRLGISYLEGSGGPADPLEAYIWLSLALLNGEARAQPGVAQLAPRLSAGQLDTARQRIAHTLGRFN